ncbi:MAG: glycerate kinase [Alphaproteobacteria bacterium]
MADPAVLLRRMFDAAVAAADPMRCVPPQLPPRPRGRTIVLGAGKASAVMAQAVEAAWPADPAHPLEGLVVTRYGHGAPCDRIEIVEAAHPVPDDAGLAAAGRILALARDAGPDDLVLCLISGGGSALLTRPAAGIGFADKQALNKALLDSGAAIGEINTVRKHVSAIKGGRLAAAAAPARVLTLAISDVPGDDPAVIASGPTVPDPTTLEDARDVLAKYGIDPPAAIGAALVDPANESPKPDDPAFARAETRIVATPALALAAAADVARAAGVAPWVLSDVIEGEARETARVLAALARGVAGGVGPERGPLAPPCVLLSGGETTVTVGRGTGESRGGRNSEFALALMLALAGAQGVHALAADTDGIDGTGPHAGAVVAPDGLARLAAAGLDARALLAAHLSHDAFAALDALVVTGPTRTNVNDFRALLILPV